jgi:pimeloyl-ACP methyl ester carboxylesterase
VFVPGSGGNHTLWEGQYKALQGEFNIAALNLPGHGLSGGAGERDVMRYVQWVKKTIGALGLRGPVLAGHSLGAAISMNFAIHEGFLLSAIVPVGGGVTMPVNPAILEKIHSDLSSVISMVVKFAVSKPNRDAVGPYLQEGLEQVNPDVFHGDLYACDRMDITQEIGKVAIPALVVCGDDDKMTPPGLSRSIAEAIPGARLALIEGAGHYVMREKPAEFNRVLAEFVRSLP